MKRFNIFPALTAFIITAASCSKNDILIPPAEQQSTPKLARVEQVGGTWAVNYSYNSAGRLVQSADNNFTVNYAYSGTPFGYEIYNSTGKKAYTITGVQLAGSKISQFMYSGINASGAVNWTDTVNQQYDASGYQVQKTYGSYKYTAEITGGNTTKQTVVNTKTGAVNYEVTAEYYTDKPNKTNLNIFEYDQFDHILSDNELFGKKNTNLLKKVTRTSANTYVYEYTYNTDASGYITSYTITYTVNGGAPTTGTYKFTYL